tara:strand:+ start:1073 stop:1210 length:138 start_codon:yes stop_codon:yes gene_type:complete
MNKILKTAGCLLLLLCVAGTMSACGKKTQPIPPDGATYPQQYPRP